jgi:anaerobic selenocysteine-containing dehydrogenase
VLPGRRWRLAPRQLVEQFAAIADVEPAPLALIPRRQARHLNSQLTVGIARTDRPSVLLATPDAKSAGIASGDEVVVASDHGRVRAIAEVTDELRLGAVSLPHGYGEPNVSMLTSATDDIDPHTGMVLQSGVAVTLTRA